MGSIPSSWSLSARVEAGGSALIPLSKAIYARKKIEIRAPATLPLEKRDPQSLVDPIPTSTDITAVFPYSFRLIVVFGASISLSSFFICRSCVLRLGFPPLTRNGTRKERERKKSIHFSTCEDKRRKGRKRWLRRGPLNCLFRVRLIFLTFNWT